MDLSELLEHFAFNDRFDIMELITEISPNFKAHNLVDALTSACDSPFAFEWVKDMVRFLIDKGVDVNSVDRHGKTALHAICGRDDEYEYINERGCARGYKEMIHGVVCLLLRRGALVNVYDSNQNTPLYYAVRCGLYDVTKKLLKRGADVNARNNDGETPMSVACHGSSYHSSQQKYGYDDDSYEMLELLLRHGAEINIRYTSHLSKLVEASALLVYGYC